MCQKSSGLNNFFANLVEKKNQPQYSIKESRFLFNHYFYRSHQMKQLLLSLLLACGLVGCQSPAKPETVKETPKAEKKAPVKKQAQKQAKKQELPFGTATQRHYFEQFTTLCRN